MFDQTNDEYVEVELEAADLKIKEKSSSIIE